MANDGDPTLTDSELEELMLALCEEYRLPRPTPRAWVAGLRVDFLFAQSRLAVEILTTYLKDAFHGPPGAADWAGRLTGAPTGTSSSSTASMVWPCRPISRPTSTS